MNIDRSQHGESQWILDHLNPPEYGLFCEVGAYDGVTSSNTYLFETLGWEGLLIEPDPDKAVECRKSRPGSITLCSAIGCSGTRDHIGTWELFPVNDEDRGTSGFGRPHNRKIIVPVLRLDFLIERLMPECPWLLSIDTEGSELDVWASLGRYAPSVVIMEYLTLPVAPKVEPILAKMQFCEYREVHRTTCNLIFTR